MKERIPVKMPDPEARTELTPQFCPLGNVDIETLPREVYRFAEDVWGQLQQLGVEPDEVRRERARFIRLYLAAQRADSTDAVDEAHAELGSFIVHKFFEFQLALHVKSLDHLLKATSDSEALEQMRGYYAHRLGFDTSAIDREAFLNLVAIYKQSRFTHFLNWRLVNEKNKILRANKASRERYAPLKQYVLGRYQTGKFQSMRQASKEITPLLQEYAAKHPSCAPLSSENAERTVYDWIRAYSYNADDH